MPSSCGGLMDKETGLDTPMKNFVQHIILVCPEFHLVSLLKLSFDFVVDFIIYQYFDSFSIFALT